jgi:serine protease Do
VGLALLWTGHGPAAGEAKKGSSPATSLPPVFSKEQPESIEDLKAIEDHVQALLPKLEPAVVGVRIGPAQGSGVIVTKDGYVLTAGHVSGLPGRDATVILPDGKTLKAKTLGRNGGIDSGMLKIEGEGEYPFIEMGKSSDLKKGQWVLAIGHPGGFRANRSPVVRVGRVLFASPEMLRTDCALVGGDSGGPLFDMNGKVIGIHSRIGDSITFNIHVPADTYRQTWARLAKGESWGGQIGQQALVQSAGGKIVYEKEGKLTKADPTDKKQQDCYAQVHLFKMVPGYAYTIDMLALNPPKKSNPKVELDPFLRLEDANGKELAEDDDGAGNLNARIVFRPTEEGEYRIIATTCDPGQSGGYKLVIRQAELKLGLLGGKVDVMPALRVPKQFAPQILEKVAQSGIALFAQGTLVDDKGKPVADKPVQFRWEKGEALIKSDDKGALKLELSKDNVKNLFLEVPQGLKVALEMTDGNGNPFKFPLPPDFEKEKVKSAGGKLLLQEEGTLTSKEALDKLRADLTQRKLDKACFHKVHTLKMTPGSTYTIDLESNDFDAYLRLEDPSGKQLAEDDDSAGKLNSRIVFTPEVEGVYRIIVTTCDPDQTGAYRLSIYQADTKKDNDKGVGAAP